MVKVTYFSILKPSSMVLIAPLSVAPVVLSHHDSVCSSELFLLKIKLDSGFPQIFHSPQTINVYKVLCTEKPPNILQSQVSYIFTGKKLLRFSKFNKIFLSFF